MNDETQNDKINVKRSWTAPTIEEIDYAQTEASYSAPGTNDFGIYSV